MAQLGLRVQLGHHGNVCPLPHGAASRFVVVDVSGLHPINLDYCGCAFAPERHQQLLRAQWFPASIQRPRTAFTFDYLHTYHKLTLQSKVALYDYVIATSHKTNHTGLVKLPVCLS